MADWGITVMPSSVPVIVADPEAPAEPEAPALLDPEMLLDPEVPLDVEEPALLDDERLALEVVDTLDPASLGPGG
jgi:hypothetical protein